MNTALSKFMSIALTAVVIVALLFGVGYSMVEKETTTDYQAKVESLAAPTTKAPTTR